VLRPYLLSCIWVLPPEEPNFDENDVFALCPGPIFLWSFIQETVEPKVVIASIVG
jgi:hypothetical protein